MYITASIKLPVLALGEKQLNLYALEPMYIEDVFEQSLRQNQLASFMAFEQKPELYKKKYYRNCLAELKAPKILIARYGGIGDIQWVLPAVREIKKRKPESIIRFACFEKDREIIFNCDFIDEFCQTHFPTAKDLEWCDYYIDFFDTVEGIGENESKYDNPININETIVGYKIENKLGFYKVEDYEKENARTLLKEKGIKDGDILISMPLVASSPYRSWNRQDELIKRLLDYKENIKVIIFSEQGNGHAEPILRRITELNNPRIINMHGKTTLRQMVALMNESKLMFSNDTGMVNIGAALGKNVVAIYTTVPKFTRISEYPSVEGVEAKCECRPCFKLSHPCENGIKCLSTISINEIYEKIISKI